MNIVGGFVESDGKIAQPDDKISTNKPRLVAESTFLETKVSVVKPFFTFSLYNRMVRFLVENTDGKIRKQSYTFIIMDIDTVNLGDYILEGMKLFGEWFEQPNSL
jgi:hypothetical protein